MRILPVNMYRLYSWNINGVRAANRKGFPGWLLKEQPDVLCLQETKAAREDLPLALTEPDGYGSVWYSAAKRGYSGTGVYYRRDREPLDIRPMGARPFDREGRVQAIEFPEFTLINAYYPNSQPERRRLDYKLRFCTAMLRLCNRLRRQGRHVVVCGDLNIAHKDIDLARPKQNRDNPGFYPEECARLDRYEKAGYRDTFRHFNKSPGHYTWWSYRANAREKNIGWRLDYHWVNEEFLERVASSTIHADVMGSDHCPVSIEVR